MSARRSQVNIEEAASLLAYLRQRQLIGSHESPRLQILHGGVSNRTVLVERESGQAWVLKQALCKLRVPVDWFSAPQRIHREAAGLRCLAGLMPGHVPRFIAEDHDQHILIMSAIPQPHDNWKQALLRGDTKLAEARQFGSLLAKIHGAVDSRPALRQQFADRRYFEELRLEPYYSYTASQVPAARHFLRRLIADTRERQLALTHGDYSPKNILRYAGRLILLDHEVMHFGDPAFDIGFSLAHFLGKALHLPQHRSAMLAMARATWRAYRDALADERLAALNGFAVRHTLACCLARAAGRSPLEYLSNAERERFLQLALMLIDADAADLEELIDRYESGLNRA